jgi:hypothetical protein
MLVAMLWLEQEYIASESASVPDTIFPALIPRNVEEISLNSPSCQTLIKKGMHGWHMVYLRGGRQVIEDFADDFLVECLLNDLAGLSAALPPRHVDKGLGEAWQEYGLGLWAQARGDSLQVRYGKLQHTLYFGTETTQKSPLVLFYARRDEEEKVLAVDAKIHAWLTNSRDNPDFWRSRQVFHLGAKALPRAIVWQSGASPQVTLRAERQGWFLYGTGNEANEAEPAAPDVANRLVDWLRALRIQEFVYPEDTSAAERDLRNAWLFGYHSEQDQEYVAIAPVKNASHLAARVYFSGDQRRIAYYYLLPATTVKVLQDMAGHVRDLRLLRFAPQAVRRIEQSGKEGWKLERNESGWSVTSPSSRAVKGEEVHSFLVRLANIEAVAVAAGDAVRPALTQSLVLTLNEAPHTIHIAWAETPDPQGLWPVLVSPYKRLLLLNTEVRQILVASYLDFYDKRVDAFVFADVAALRAERPGRVYEAVKDGETWRLLKPVAAPAEQTHLEEILRCCAWIMAYGVLGEGEEARRAFACGDAAYRLQVRTRATQERLAIERTIEIGRVMDEKYYALWVSGFPFVYKVDRKLKDAMDAELYSCQPLLAADAWRAASEIVVRRRERQLRYADGVWREQDGEPSNKGEKLWQLLPRLRIAHMAEFTSAVLPEREADMAIRVNDKSGEHVLWLWRERDQLIGTWPSSGQRFVLENDAAAVLWQETE